MPIKFLERPKVNAAELDELPKDSAPAVDHLQFRTITDDDVQRLNDLFYRHQCAVSRVAVSGAALAAGGAVLSGGSAFAAAGGAGANAAEAAADSIADGVANAIEMIQAIDGIGLAAFGVALAPMGFMVTLRVLNMVLSRV
jgi:hypothetical protein